jgi:sialate O-acetylesterase
MLTRSFRFSSLAVVFALAGPLYANVRLPKILSSHMVVQRDRPIHIWGWSDPGEEIRVTLNSATESTTASDLGRWSVYLPPQPAGGPVQIRVEGNNTIVLDDVLIGDVWFASGQSNMQFPLKGFPTAPLNNSAEEISRANQPNIRLLFVPNKASSFPLRDYEQGWIACTPETAANFSAVAYFFGRDLAAAEHVPIGLIDSSWGGTPAGSWVSLEGVSSDAGLMPVFAEHVRMADEEADVPLHRAADARAIAAARAANQPPPRHSWHPNFESWTPAWLFNGMVAPALPFPIKGVIWYQGESDSGIDRASMYAKVFPALIADWREHWQEGNFPFLYVQISNYKSNAKQNWPIVREAQRRTLAVTNTGMAVTIDIGNPNNVHPSDKQDVGRRLALAARAIAYGEKIEYSGPLFRQISIDNSNVRVWFDHAESGLVAKDGPLEGFEIAGTDRRFVTATARIDGDTVIVSSPGVPDPKYVRYGWANAPVVNLFNSIGLPASPFTSEREIPAP